MRRRSLLQWTAAALAGVPGLRRLGWAQTATGALGPAAEATLRALAAAVLPESLGPARQVEILDGFRRWLRGYAAGAELDHGYGRTKLRVSGPSPAAAYERQLAALEDAARREGSSFAELPLDRRRTLVVRALEDAKLEDLPERPDGGHIAADLMACFFRSAEGADLCYRAAIARDQCRGLPGSEDPPEPLREGH